MEATQAARKPYPSDVSDEEWAFVAPYLTLMREDAPQREYRLREVFNGLRYVVKTGAPWRWMPNDLPPWPTVYQQSQRWLRGGALEAVAHELRALLRVAAGRPAEPTAVMRRRSGRPRPARPAARGCRTTGRTDSGDPGRPDTSEHAREWGTGGV